MIKPEKFKAPYIPKEKIWSEADALRNQFPQYSKLPVDVLKIAEIGLGLEFDFKPLSGIDGEALLQRDLKTIVVDKEAFVTPSMENRLRFSVAHELGHLRLHADIYGQLNFNTVDEWKDFIGKIPHQEYAWIEWQAYEFAGRLLVPIETLRKANNEALKAAKLEGYWEPDETRTMAFEFVSRAICRDFKVSASVIERRLIREGLWTRSED